MEKSYKLTKVMKKHYTKPKLNDPKSRNRTRLKIIQSPCPRQDALESMKKYSKGTTEDTLS